MQFKINEFNSNIFIFTFHKEIQKPIIKEVNFFYLAWKKYEKRKKGLKKSLF